MLKRKKMYEGQRDSLAQQQFNLDQQAFTIESLKDTASTVETMKQSAQTLKTEYKKINIDKVEDLQDDLAELMIDAEEVQEVMTRDFGNLEDVNEDDLDAELAALDEMEFDIDEEEGVPDYLKASEMPSAPDTAVSAGASATDEYGLPKEAEAVQQ